MANIHRLGDYNNNNQNNNYGRPNFGGGNQRVDNAFSSQPLLGGMGGRGGPNVQFVDPRRETFFDMLKFTCCPTFTIYSFIFFITMIEILVYIVTVVVTLVDGSLSPDYFLGPSYDVLDTFGAEDPTKLYCGFQIQRFITPILLHTGFLHIFSNMVSQLIIGFMLENLLGPLRVAGIYFVSGFGGNLFSALCYPSKGLAVGASTSIFGLISTLLAIVFVNWKALDRSPEVRCCLIAMVCFVLFLTILMSFSSGNFVKGYGSVDQYGHLGGIISGFFIATYLMVHFRGSEASRRGSYEGKTKLVGLIGTLFFFILNLTLFFTVTKNSIRC